MQSNLTASQLAQHVFNRLGFGTNATTQRLSLLLKKNADGSENKAATAEAIAEFIANGLNQTTRVNPTINQALKTAYPFASMTYEDIVAQYKTVLEAENVSTNSVTTLTNEVSQTDAALNQTIQNLESGAPNVVPLDALKLIAQMQQQKSDLTTAQTEASSDAIAFITFINSVRSQSQMREMAYYIFDNAQPVYMSLQHFWFNHFNVSIDNSPIDTMDYIDTLGENMCGSFEDLLLASAKHPAMLVFLNGASNRTVFKKDKSSPNGYTVIVPPNENYAREVMELFTIGRGPATDVYSSPYSQTDVTQVALILSGWNLAGASATDPTMRGFVFNTTNNMPTTRTVMGKSYAPGEAGALAFFHDLATSPYTEDFIIRKIIHRFVSEDGIPQTSTDPWISNLISLKAAMSSTWESTGGSLNSVMMTMFSHPAFWDANAYKSKARTPVQYVASLYRATGYQLADLKTFTNSTTGALYTDINTAVNEASSMGEQLLFCGVPTGWDDSNITWGNNAVPLESARFSFAIGSFHGAPSSSMESQYQKLETEAAKGLNASEPSTGMPALNAFIPFFDFDPFSRFQFPASYSTAAGPLAAIAANADTQQGVALPLRSILTMVTSSADFMKY